MIIGIDLGTTNSLVAYLRDGEPKIIPNRLGKNLTPSVVSVDEEGTVYVGESAKERLLLYPETSAAVFKRTMGTDKKYRLGDRDFNSEELSSFILRALKEDAETFLGEPVTEAIISVPAYFNDKRRKATKRAGELAGLKVERIISEPTAAAISYGICHRNQNTKFLVFDLGGGTFDVSVLELFNNILEVRAVAGDNYLGGEDFTQVLLKLFCDKNNIEFDKLENKEKNKLINAVERGKIDYSNGVKNTIKYAQYDMEIVSDEYEEACEELFDKIREPIKKSLSDSKIKLKDIDMVILVGGATRLPIVQKFVGRLFKQFPNTNVNPDEAVALGCATQGAMKERNESIKEIILTDVCPFTLGTEVVRELEEGRYENGHFCPIIERNTVIPASRTERLYTIRDNQTRMHVTVLQGESRFANNNLLIGEINVELPKAKAGVESLDLTYTYDINSILEVEATVTSTGKKVRQVFKGQSVDMTDEEIAKRLEEISYLKIQPREQEENKLLLLKGERLYEESIGMKRQEIEHHINQFERALNTQDSVEIDTARREFKEYLDEIE